MEPMVDLPLHQRAVLLVDCQTTGANPAHGHLLELAWAMVRPRGPELTPTLGVVTSTLVALPDGARIPRRVQQLTGITDEDLEGAPTADEVWERFHAALQRADLVVIHYARFERPFLQALAETAGASFDDEALICTHEIGRRLFAAVPRRGIRALSGYLGHAMEEERRARSHVEASFVIWRGCMEELAEREVHSLRDLRHWLETTSAPRRGRKRDYLVSREQRLALPREPGVYRMLGRPGNVLYVGKATSLRERVNSYFRGQKGKRDKTLELVSQIHDIAIDITATPLEAALLENDQIKAHRPPYNIALRARQRSVCFLHPDHLTPLDDPTATAALGPLSHPDHLTLWRPLLIPEASAGDALQAAELQPTARVAQQAYALARQSLGLPAEGPVPLQRLLSTGADLWIARQVARFEAQQARAAASELTEVDLSEGAAAADDEDGQQEPVGYREWVEAHLEDPAFWSQQIVYAIRAGARQIRRSRWLLDLAQSALRWHPPNDHSRHRHLLMDGAMVAEATWADAAPPDPPLRSVRQRQAWIDLLAHDRLIILTAELRRLSATPDSDVSLRLGHRVTLDDAALRARLWWF